MVRYTEILSDTIAEEQRSRSMRETEVPIYSCVSVIGDRATERERQEERKKEKEGGGGKKEERKEKEKEKKKEEKERGNLLLSKNFRSIQIGY